MLGKPNNFSLNFNTGGQQILFPIPMTNQYQNISRLTYSLNAQQFIEKEFGNKTLVFPQEKPSQLLFLHQSKSVFYDFDSIRLLKITSHMSDDKYISSTGSDLVALNRKLIPADKVSEEQVVKHLYYGLIDYLEYGNPIDGLYTFSQALKDKKTDCGGFATLLASLLKVNGIHSRLVVGYLLSKKRKTQLKRLIQKKLTFNDISMHAWLEVPTSQGWFPLDPSIEWKRLRGLSHRQGGFGYTPDDRLVVSYGHNLSMKINKKEYSFPILQHPEKLL